MFGNFDGGITEPFMFWNSFGNHSVALKFPTISCRLAGANLAEFAVRKPWKSCIHEPVEAPKEESSYSLCLAYV